ncbi:MAG: DeoR/GlpR transcriptional regulator [Acidimicrobiaceae bacterium]|nr:DeoR/GlpR transcriptional regulator [Ilumatobacter sp.]MCB9382539.1 DeoR/GlpR transcriptional regulator [Acidimicrobiaceae bacterium]MCO5328817.1 DeoR/GlpR family DNA-binding transcription regulator [Ilumatobacteraceae bacterium]
MTSAHPPTDLGATRALARQRHDVILAEVRRRGAARVSDLAQLLGVSDMTVRRDLEVLDEAGLLAKVHGGATLPEEHSTDEPGFEAKLQRNTREKHAIAIAAAALVRPGSAIGITAGTTTWQFASHIIDIAGLTVVTNSIQVAEVLHHSQRADRTVVLTGGVRTPSDALVGPVAAGALRSLHLDMVFMGVHGMSSRAGFTTPNLMEAETNRAFVTATEHLVVLADHSKWGITGLSSMATLDDAAVLVTDRGLADSARAELGERVGRLVLADPAFAEDTDTADTSTHDRRRA